MEKINIAEILKDCSCPSGMELNCTIYEDVYFDYVDSINIIHCYIQHETYKTSLTFNQYGIYNIGIKAKCVIFPKGKTTWEGFQRPFKDGDILISGLEGCEGNSFIFKRINGFGNAQCYCAINCFGQLILNNDNWTPIKGCRLANPKEKQKLFDAIKANGYKWNEETKTLENLIEPRFKVGDRIKAIINNNQYDIKELTDTHYTLVEVNYKFKYTEPISEDKNWELVPNKFDISNLKPFDKVLVRCSSLEKWHIQFFEKYNTESSAKFPFICLCYNKYSQCIPYENNQHLLDTANDCNDFYKTWK